MISPCVLRPASAGTLSQAEYDGELCCDVTRPTLTRQYNLLYQDANYTSYKLWFIKLVCQ